MFLGHANSKKHAFHLVDERENFDFDILHSLANRECKQIIGIFSYYRMLFSLFFFQLFFQYIMTLANFLVKIMSISTN